MSCCEVEKKELAALKARMWVAIILSVPLIVNMGIPEFYLPGWIQLILALIVQVYGGTPFYIGSYQSLRHFRAYMDVLVALGTTVAFLYSVFNLFWGNADHLYFETSAVLIAFILIGRLLEQWSKQNAKKGMSALLNMQSRNAVVVRDGESLYVKVEDVVVGDRVVIAPFQRVPVDGKIVKGSTSIDESMLTGESIPVYKDEGANVFSGTVNGAGRIEVDVSAEHGSTFLNHIVDLVTKAQNTKPPIQRQVDLVASWFVPSVLIIALLTFLIWYFVFGSLVDGVINAVSVLVIACPCALGLATPMVIMVATSRAAREGILIKDAVVFEQMHKMNKLVLDKTGTVTLGRLTLIDVQSRPDIKKEFLLEISATMCKDSDHPAAAAIFEHSKGREKLASEYKVVPGKGVEATIDGVIYRMGSSAFIEEMGLQVSDLVKQDFHTVVVVSDKKRVLGSFSLRDSIKDCAFPFIKNIRQAGIEPILLSGDRRSVVKQVAGELGILDYYAEVSPENKAEMVLSIKEGGAVIGMVGDGVNDAVAIAKSDVGFALGSGTDVAMESASVGIMRRDLENVYRAIAIGTLTHRKMWQNLGFAFIYNIFGIFLAAFGCLNPMVAGAAMALSSISVVINAILLRYSKIA